MAVGFKTGYYWYNIGTGSFLHSFFSTIAVNLENGNWGSKYPMIMKKLYNGYIEPENIEKAINELMIIKRELTQLPPDRVVWDAEDLKKLPPWGDNISSDITNLSNYYVTSDGEDFITLFMHALEKSRNIKMPLEIESL